MEQAELTQANQELLDALNDAIEALEYASRHLNNPAINGHRVLLRRLEEARLVAIRYAMPQYVIVG